MTRPEAASRVVDVQELIDAHPLSPVQKRLLLLCFTVVAIDGFDTLLGGVLVGFGWAAATVYALVAIPAVISALALATLGIVRRRQSIV